MERSGLAAGQTIDNRAEEAFQFLRSIIYGQTQLQCDRSAPNHTMVCWKDLASPTYYGGATRKTLLYSRLVTKGIDQDTAKG